MNNLKSWILTDVSSGIYLDSISLSASELGKAAKHCTITKRTMRGGLSDGVDIIEVDNGTFRFSVLPTRGMNVWKGSIGETTIGWKSPVQGPVHPNFVPLADQSGLGFLHGFDELICRCGLNSNGAPVHDEQGKLLFPLHGRIANLPAKSVSIQCDTQSGEISITGVVIESSLFFQNLQLTSTIKTLPGEAGFRIYDTVTNLSNRPVNMELLYHINFGSPLLEPNSQFVAPVKTMVPCNARAAEGTDSWQVYGDSNPNYTEQVYFCELAANANSQTRSMLHNANATLGVSIHQNTNQLPYFTLWKNTAGKEDGYVTGLEPGTSFPNPTPFEGKQGRVIQLSPGEERQFEIGFELHPNANSVSAGVKSISELQEHASPTIHSTPQKGWCSSCK